MSPDLDTGFIHVYTAIMCEKLANNSLSEDTGFSCVAVKAGQAAEGTFNKKHKLRGGAFYITV